METAFNTKQIQRLKTILDPQTQKWALHAQALALQLKANNPTLCAMNLNPKIIHKKYREEWKAHQAEYINFYCKALSNFDAVVEILLKYCGNDPMVSLLIKLDREITDYKEKFVYPKYPEMKEVEGTFTRNDFLFEGDGDRMFQTENNLVSVSCTHFYDNFSYLLQKIFYDLDFYNQFKSKIDYLKKKLISILFWLF